MALDYPLQPKWCLQFWLQKGDGFPDSLNQYSLYGHADLIHTYAYLCTIKILLVSGFGLGQQKVSCITNSIETAIFGSKGKKSRFFHTCPERTVMTQQLLQLYYINNPGLKLETSTNSGLPQTKVSELLQQSLGFLSFGHPEGFGLPLPKKPAAVPYWLYRPWWKGNLCDSYGATSGMASKFEIGRVHIITSSS